MYILERNNYDINGHVYDENCRLNRSQDCPQCGKYIDLADITSFVEETTFGQIRVTSIAYNHSNNNICTIPNPYEEEKYK